MPVALSPTTTPIQGPDATYESVPEVLSVTATATPSVVESSIVFEQVSATAVATPSITETIVLTTVRRVSRAGGNRAMPVHRTGNRA